MDATGQGQTEPVDGLSGVRHEGGVTPAQASMRNIGTCRRDAKGEAQAGAPCKSLSTDARRRGGVVRRCNTFSDRACSLTGFWRNTVGNRSRMNREIHVRFCEGLRVRFPWATHLRSSLIGRSTHFVRAFNTEIVWAPPIRPVSMPPDTSARSITFIWRAMLASVPVWSASDRVDGFGPDFTQ